MYCMNDSTFQFMLTLTKGELAAYACNAVRKNNENKGMVLKYSKMLECNMNKPLSEAIKNNDILSLALCLKYGASLKNDEDDVSYIHYCCLKGYDVLLKAIIKELIKTDTNIVEDLDNGLTPLQVALYYENYECAKVLMNYNVNVTWIDYDDDKFSCCSSCRKKRELQKQYNEDIDEIIDKNKYKNKDIDIIDLDKFSKKKEKLIDIDDSDDDIDEDNEEEKIKYINALDIIINSYNPNHMKFIELVLPKIVSFTEQTYFHMLELISKKKYSEVDLILTKFSQTINKNINGDTLMLQIIKTKNKELINKFLRLETTDFKVITNPPYLHYLAYHYDYDNIEYILKKNKDAINFKCEDNFSTIEYFLLNSIRDTKIPENIVKMIKLLLDKGCNVVDKYETLNIAIQLGCTEVINLLMKYGVTLDRKIKNDKIYFPPHNNNDILGFAAQIGDPKMIEYLLNKKTVINIYSDPDNKYTGLPTSLLIAIKCGNEKAIKYLNKRDEIKKICLNKNKLLFEFTINNGDGNREIMREFAPNDVIDSLNLDIMQLKLDSLERKMDMTVIDYKNNRIEVLTCLSNILNFLKICGTIKNKSEIGKLVNKYYSACSSSFFRPLQEKGLHLILKTTNMTDVNELFNIVKCLDDEDFIDNLFQKLLDIQNITLLEEIENIQNYILLVEKCYKKFKSKVKDEIIENKNYIICYANDDKSYIERVLVKLKYPVKLDHYDEMCNKIRGSHCIMTETETCITVRDDYRDIAVNIFKIKKLRVPLIWFDFYSYNIGLKHKSDLNHMFPFVLDKKLKSITCFEKRADDAVNKFGSIYLKYFYGTLTVKNQIVFGLFEYFIDATGTLFHRLFRPYDEVPEKIKLSVMKYFPDDLKKRYRL
jgi:ankyrin repeat protein